MRRRLQRRPVRLLHLVLLHLGLLLSPLLPFLQWIVSGLLDAPASYDLLLLRDVDKVIQAESSSSPIVDQ